MERRKNALDLCSLLHSILTGSQPQGLEDMDLAAVHSLAKANSLASMAYCAVQDVPMEPELKAAWKQHREQMLRKSLLMFHEKERITGLLDENGIWYMPLKGSILSGFYPGIGMREMADMDILFDASRRRQLKRIMEGLGYRDMKRGRSHHDVYQKPPIYNFEMHVNLFNPGTYGDYYKNIRSRLLEGPGMQLKFTEEDFYAYFLAHGWKHFSNSGNGLRFLVDARVYLAAKGRQLDMEKLAPILDALGLGEFEATVRSLSEKLFGTPAPLDEKELALFDLCVFSGTYGNREIFVANKLDKLKTKDAPLTFSTKLRYLWRRIWPEKEWFSQLYPFYAKHWYLKPFFLMKRAVKGLLFKGKHILKELRLLKKAK